MMNELTSFLAAARFVEIPSYHVAAFEKNLVAAVKRANKLGVVALSYVMLGEYEQTRTVTREVDGGMQSFKVDVTMHGYLVHGELPKMNGYTLAGVLEFLGDGAVMIREVPGQSLPESYRTATASCDHCRKARRRGECVVVQHEDGTYMQVGKSCCKDFLGHKFDALLSGVLFESYIPAVDGEEEGGYGGHAPELYILEAYLASVCAAVRDAKGAFVPSSMDGSTKNVAYASYFNRKGAVKREASDFDTAREWIAQAREILTTKGALSNYEHNLYLGIRKDLMPESLSGVVASLPKYLGRTEARKRAAAVTVNSEYQGTIGKRLDATLTIGKRFTVETQFGTLSIYSMTDADGNVFVYKTGSGLCDKASGDYLMEGATFVGRGTVKEHSEYKGTKQTVLSRMMVLSVQKEAA